MKFTQTNFYHRSLQCLLEADVATKLTLVGQLQQDFLDERLVFDEVNLPDVKLAGHPQKPDLVSPREVPKRKLGSEKGKAAAIHSFCHIEFNAINLACDALYRFRGFPLAYYEDWVKVAAEEALHFSLLQKRLHELGFRYGDFPAHQGLWELARKTAHDPLHRMAMVPRVMEARGLDVTPAIQQKFLNVGDRQTADILSIILRDEIGHVEVGSRWFHYLCEQQGVDAETTYFALLDRYMNGEIRCPLHHEARLQAGFSEAELDHLEALCKQPRKKN